uniref:Uncharacterized protein n=1 Tax=Polytomella parva TaxID=51329 RepID=A0A7S0UQB1_9CHLO|eukprot:CAMPEP_0175044470 /NCGR_PEP_ID=MMETSP0052_2-20121109/3826_1 /TAXON_ID=51329 ORGANISM="Polytomella parva, Strain SAG 63-3" /NCGR_SAMPLE_ID=MMETSP0052_2 /ASSEMBLY_ACC=CAM_ASM_000194 /LENGTH=109 /DNA_ID=CAMNT_0016307775 /DNA_START=100 /DNA_END=429 /DNA_ORIENTATION=-
MVPAPKRLDSVEIHNVSNKNLNIKVTFMDSIKDHKEIVQTITIHAGDKKVAGPVVLDMGSWQGVAPVQMLEVIEESGAGHSLTPSVMGVVNQLSVIANEENGRHILKVQ